MVAGIKNNVNELSRNYQAQLAEAAFDYLNFGLSLFYELGDHQGYANPQAALGNLAIAIELMLKAFIAQKSLLLLFKGLPLETRVLLACPDSLPSNFPWRRLDIELRTATDKIIDLGECISLFFVFFPNLRQPLKAHLDFLANARNASVHSILPPFQKYEVERAAYLALKIYDTLNSANVIGYQRDDKQDAEFLNSFQASTLERVQAKLRVAKENAKNLSGERVTIDLKSLPSSYALDYWSRFVVPCPICGNDALAGGFSQAETTEADEFGPEEEIVRFYPDHFRCDACRLGLDDYYELQAAGIKTFYEREEDAPILLRKAIEEVSEAEGW